MDRSNRRTRHQGCTASGSAFSICLKCHIIRTPLSFAVEQNLAQMNDLDIKDYYSMLADLARWTA
jgi:hypothetical protein